MKKWLLGLVSALLLTAAATVSAILLHDIDCMDIGNGCQQCTESIITDDGQLFSTSHVWCP